jgi:ectoine hydroxylase-related dioxygenase (phytanoyl-CoA dioxygenase family)
VDVPEEHVTDATACELPAGGATVHDSRTLHYTGPNRTDRPRRAYILIFGNQPRERDEPRDFYWQE